MTEKNLYEKEKWISGAFVNYPVSDCVNCSGYLWRN